jgi:hypothetical protein
MKNIEIKNGENGNKFLPLLDFLVPRDGRHANLAGRVIPHMEVGIYPISN